MTAVFDGRVRFLGFLELPVYRILGTGPDQEQSWQRYAGSRFLADETEEELLQHLQRHQGAVLWETTERLMVAVTALRGPT